MEENNFILPSYITEKYQDLFSLLPSIIQTKNITKEGIDELTKKNKLIWFRKFFDGNKLYNMEGLISYGSKPDMIYYDKVENENVYKFYILTNGENNEAIFFLIKSLNKYNTID